MPAWIAVGQWTDGEVARAQQQDDEKNELESDDPFDLGLKSGKEVSWGMQHILPFDNRHLRAWN